MNKNIFLLALVLLSFVSCGKKQSEPYAQKGANEFVSEEQGDGIQRMSAYDFSDTLRVDGRVYSYTIHREFSDSLPVITDDDGNRYADNYYTLTVRTGEQTVFTRRFTKSTFASYLSKGFVQKGILDGMMCDRSLPGMTFAVSVSMPQSDMFEPLLLRVDANGGYVISRDERGEAELDEFDIDGV